jgi:hypothetical protein
MRLSQRLLPSVAALALYLVFAMLWREHNAAFVALEMALDFQSSPVPYTDLNAILTAAACAHQGVNVYVPSACMDGGVYNYSPFFLHLGLGLGPAGPFSGGLLCGVLFLAAAMLLPPARGRVGLAVRSLALCSSAAVWALETANLDVLLFVLSVLGLCLLLAGRGAGYVLFALGGALKFYPAVLLALALRESRRRFAVIAIFVAAAGAVFLWRYGQGVATALAIVPAGLPFRGLFGAIDYPLGLAMLRFEPVLTAEPSLPQISATLNLAGVRTYVVIATGLLMLVALFTSFRLAPRYAAPLMALPAPEKLFLVAGALVIALCFFVSQNLDYRAIFLLLTVPALQLWARDASGRLLLAATLLLLWEAAIRHACSVLGPALLGGFGAYPEIVFWMLREYAWWFVIVRLTAIVTAYLRAAVPALLQPARAEVKAAI